MQDNRRASFWSRFCALLALIATLVASLSLWMVITDRRTRSERANTSWGDHFLLSFLDERVKKLELDRDGLASVELDPYDPTFRRIKTQSTDFFVSCSRAEPYLQGIKLYLEIGNPASVDFADTRLSFKFGAKPPDPFSSSLPSNTFDNWKESLSTKEIKLTTLLKAGVWNPVEVVLSPAPSNLAMHIEMSVQTSTVVMKRPSEER